ncbi:MAG: prepilin-type N-terminal cleavage/methylation domain-containing protein [Candidatus Omnitrophica bacterium]|nr:prepilin-type N-terminal cleavage/methylation domain-containing protein [Candidatus Omnitrophota bacterium]
MEWTMMNKRAFTLIELLIVIAIILILISIALPNFLAAQIRAKVARAEADLRAMTTALEFFRSEYRAYPIGTDDSGMVPIEIEDHFSQYGPYGFYTFRTVFSGNGASTLGYQNLPEGTPLGAVPGLTSPNRYMQSIPTDPFSKLPGFVFYSYREDRDGQKIGWIVTSFGPDQDEAENAGKNAPSGATIRTPLLPLLDARGAGRYGDINEKAGHPGSNFTGFNGDVPKSLLMDQLRELAYSPTNGTNSEGDIYRIGP